MKPGHFHPFVSRRVTAIVLMHWGAKTNQARNASAVGLRKTAKQSANHHQAGC